MHQQQVTLQTYIYIVVVVVVPTKSSSRLCLESPSKTRRSSGVWAASWRDAEWSRDEYLTEFHDLRGEGVLCGGS